MKHQDFLTKPIFEVYVLFKRLQKFKSLFYGWEADFFFFFLKQCYHRCVNESSIHLLHLCSTLTCRCKSKSSSGWNAPQAVFFKSKCLWKRMVEPFLCACGFSIYLNILAKGNWFPASTRSLQGWCPSLKFIFNSCTPLLKQIKLS